MLLIGFILGVVADHFLADKIKAKLTDLWNKLKGNQPPAA